MKAFIIGGTGLIGYHTANELLKRGHEVQSVGLTPLPKTNLFAKKTNYSQANIEELTNHEIVEMLKGTDWLLYACSTNSLEIVKAPAEEYYRIHNILLTERIFKLAQQAGVKKVILLSDAYEYFNVHMDNLRLEKHHPYIKATFEQENVARRYNTVAFPVIILQVAQIWGYMPRRKPLHYESVMEMYRTNNFSTFKGSYPVISASQVAQAICGAFEKIEKGQTIAIAGDNIKYKEINENIMIGLNMKPYVPYHCCLRYKWHEKRRCKVLKKSGLETGINLVKIYEFRQKDAFIDPEIAKKLLGVEPTDVRKEIQETAKVILEFARLHKEI